MITRSKPIADNIGEASFSTRAEIPDGVHIAKILTADETQTLTGIPYLDLKLEIAGHENDKRIYTKIWLSNGKGNDDRNYDALLSCGHIPDHAGALPDPAAELFVHRACRVRIGTNRRGYKDVMFWIAPKVEKTTPTQAPTPLVATPQAITHDVLAKHTSASNGSRPAFTRPTRSAHPQGDYPPQTVDDDDIPF